MLLAPSPSFPQGEYGFVCCRAKTSCELVDMGDLVKRSTRLILMKGSNLNHNSLNPNNTAGLTSVSMYHSPLAYCSGRGIITYSPLHVSLVHNLLTREHSKAHIATSEDDVEVEGQDCLIEGSLRKRSVSSACFGGREGCNAY